MLFLFGPKPMGISFRSSEVKNLNAPDLIRPEPSKSYSGGYEIVELKLPKETIQVMMGSRGIEFVVSKAFIKKYSNKNDLMEFPPTQVKLSDYQRLKKYTENNSFFHLKGSSWFFVCQ